MKKLVTAVVIAAFAVLPIASLPIAAQAKDKHEGMEGSPNAAGFKKQQGGADTDKEQSSGKMKGPPNANGYEKK